MGCSGAGPVWAGRDCACPRRDGTGDRFLLLRDHRPLFREDGGGVPCRQSRHRRQDPGGELGQPAAEVAHRRLRRCELGHFHPRHPLAAGLRQGRSGRTARWVHVPRVQESLHRPVPQAQPDRRQDLRPANCSLRAGDVLQQGDADKGRFPRRPEDLGRRRCRRAENQGSGICRLRIDGQGHRGRRVLLLRAVELRWRCGRLRRQGGFQFAGRGEGADAVQIAGRPGPDAGRRHQLYPHRSTGVVQAGPRRHDHQPAVHDQPDRQGGTKPRLRHRAGAHGHRPVDLWCDQFGHHVFQFESQTGRLEIPRFPVHQATQGRIHHQRRFPANYPGRSHRQIFHREHAPEGVRGPAAIGAFRTHRDGMGGHGESGQRCRAIGVSRQGRTGSGAETGSRPGEPRPREISLGK